MVFQHPERRGKNSLEATHQTDVRTSGRRCGGRCYARDAAAVRTADRHRADRRRFGERVQQDASTQNLGLDVHH